MAVDRLTALRKEVRHYGKIAREARAAEQFAPAVSAEAKATELRREIHRIERERESEGLDEVERLALRAAAAAADGSWVAAGQLDQRAEKARRERDAEAQRRLEAAKRDVGMTEAKVIELVSRLPDTVVERIVAALKARIGEKRQGVN